MPDSPIIYRPGDGSRMGDMLELMNDLLASAPTPGVHVVAWAVPAASRADVECFDENNQLVDTPDLVILTGTPVMETVALFVGSAPDSDGGGAR